MNRRRAAWAAAVVGVTAAFYLLCGWRDAGQAGPHHDEAIALLAANGLEREYQRRLVDLLPPFGVVAPASDWQAFTRGHSPVSFSDIRDDLMSQDRHPPLAFWLLNRWLSVPGTGGYKGALSLTRLQVIIAGGLLAVFVIRHSGDWTLALLALIVFLAGNSAVYTATWVRQQALLLLLFALVAVASGELTRGRLSAGAVLGWASGLGVASLLGMLTQYTFVVWTGPMHVFLLGWCAARRQLFRLLIVVSAQLLALMALLVMLPGAYKHAKGIALGEALQAQWFDALAGIPQMLVPVPGSAPLVFLGFIGAVILVIVLAMLIRLVTSFSRDESKSEWPGGVIGSAMVGSGLLQVALVWAGVFPSWATGPNHLCAFWWAAVVAAFRGSSDRKLGLAKRLGGVGIGVLVATQIVFAWHCHRIKPRVNSSYVSRLNPDLVAIDNPSRGFVLQLTETFTPSQRVLVAPPLRLAGAFGSQDTARVRSILYLPMGESVIKGMPVVVAAARRAGYRATRLPVVHAGAQEAVLLERNTSTYGGTPPASAARRSGVTQD